MKTLLAISSQEDRRFFDSITDPLDKKDVSISVYTTAGKKYQQSEQNSNEDSFAVGEATEKLIAAVFDGASGAVDLPNGEKGGRFASNFLSSYLQAMESFSTPKNVMIDLNNALHIVLKKFGIITEEVINDLPAAAATVIALDVKKNTCHIGHIGDTFCLVIYKDGSSACLTQDQVKKFDDINYSVMKKISEEKQISPRETITLPEVKKSMQFTGTMRNKPDGTGKGYLNGNKNAEMYIQEVVLSLDNVAGLLLGTDGLIPPGLDVEKEKDRQKILQIIQEGGLEKLIITKQQVEDADPDWKLIRYKHSDDATGIYMKL